MDHCCEDRHDYYETDRVIIVEDPHLRHRHHHHPNHYNNHGNSLSFQEKPIVLDNNCFRGGERYRAIDEKYNHEGGLDDNCFRGGERYRVIDEKYGHKGGLFGGGESRVTYSVEEVDYFIEDEHKENDYHRRQQHARRNFI